MKNYPFTLEIPAESEQEATLKFRTMMDIAAFLKDFKFSNLLGSLIFYAVHKATSGSKQTEYGQKPPEKTSSYRSEYPRRKFDNKKL